MLFRNRKHSGQVLAKELVEFKNGEDVVVIGLPRGGVVTAAEVAKELNLPLDVICPRKIGAPFNPELALGAITETGEGVFNENLMMQLGLTEEQLKPEIEHEKKVAKKRLEMYRQEKNKIPLENKTVILVDDGLATGATMKAAIKSVEAEGASSIVVAVPVGPPDTIEEIQNMATKVVCPYAPTYFAAVGQFYSDFSQTEDEEVIQLLNTES